MKRERSSERLTIDNIKEAVWKESSSHQEVGPVSRLTTLWQAAGDDKGLEIEVIDVEQEVGDGEAKEAEGK